MIPYQFAHVLYFFCSLVTLCKFREYCLAITKVCVPLLFYSAGTSWIVFGTVQFKQFFYVSSIPYDIIGHQKILQSWPNSGQTAADPVRSMTCDGHIRNMTRQSVSGSGGEGGLTCGQERILSLLKTWIRPGTVMLPHPVGLGVKSLKSELFNFKPVLRIWLRS